MSFDVIWCHLMSFDVKSKMVLEVSKSLLGQFVTFCDIAWHFVTFFDIFWHFLTLNDIEWHVMTWHDMTWHDMTSWHDIMQVWMCPNWKKNENFIYKTFDFRAVFDVLFYFRKIVKKSGTWPTLFKFDQLEPT